MQEIFYRSGSMIVKQTAHLTKKALASETRSPRLKMALKDQPF
jgi:hypothetical protein